MQGPAHDHDEGACSLRYRILARRVWQLSTNTLTLVVWVYWTWPGFRVKSFFYGGFGTSTPPTLQNCMMAPSAGWAFWIHVTRFDKTSIFSKCSTSGGGHHTVLSSRHAHWPIKSKKKTFDSDSRLVAKNTILLPDYSRDITDKSCKYLSLHIEALNQTFSIFWTFTGHLAALNQNFESKFLFGATKCPEKYFRNLSHMSLVGTLSKV